MQFENKFRKTSAHPLTVYAIFPFLSSQPTSQAYSAAFAAPLSSLPIISHSLSLPIQLPVGGALEKVVHFWISGFFEVSPSLLLVCNLSFLSFISPLICLPFFLSLTSSHLLSFSLPTLFLFHPLCCLLHLFDPQSSPAFLHWLQGFSHWPDLPLTLDFWKMSLKFILKQQQVCTVTQKVYWNKLVTNS